MGKGMTGESDGRSRNGSRSGSESEREMASLMWNGEAADEIQHCWWWKLPLDRTG